MAPERQARKVNSLLTLSLSLVLALVGVVLLVLANRVISGWLATVVEQVGGTVLVAALLSVAWDFFGRRALASEVMEIAGLSGDVEQAGLVGIGSNFRQAPWDRLLRADKIDIYLGLGRTFYTNNSTALQALAGKPGAVLRVILPDPADDAAMSAWLNASPGALTRCAPTSGR